MEARKTIDLSNPDEVRKKTAEMFHTPTVIGKNPAQLADFRRQAAENVAAIMEAVSFSQEVHAKEHMGAKRNSKAA